jgi:hypothetical protein
MPNKSNLRLGFGLRTTTEVTPYAVGFGLVPP